MEKGFDPMPGAEGWQLSNAPVLSMAAYRASLDIFKEVGGMAPLIEKSRKLTAYLEFLITELNKEISGKEQFPLEIITPKENKYRGAQLSIVAHGFGKDLFKKLIENGVIPDWREPNVIRLAPVPLYNSFEDMHRFVAILRTLIQN